MNNENQTRSKSRYTELKTTLEADRSYADKAELFILGQTKDLKRDYEVACENEANAEGFVRAERVKVAKLRDEVLPQLAKDYNDAIAGGRPISALQKKRADAQKELEFAEGWLTGKNIEPNKNLKPKYAPSDAEQTIETARLAKQAAGNAYRNSMQAAYMVYMDKLTVRASSAMADLFEAYEDKWRITQRCAANYPGFRSPVPNPVTVTGFITTIYRSQSKKIRYQKMCALFPRAVVAGKHALEKLIRDDRNKAEAKHNRIYNGQAKAFVSNAVRCFKNNNPEADFKSVDMKQTVKDIEASAKARFRDEHPMKPFVYNPQTQVCPIEEKVNDPADYIYNIEENVKRVAAETKARHEADVATGRDIPQTKRRPNLKVSKSTGFAKNKKEKDIEKEAAFAKAAQHVPGEDDEYARGLTAADMM